MLLQVSLSSCLCVCACVDGICLGQKLSWAPRNNSGGECVPNLGLCVVAKPRLQTKSKHTWEATINATVKESQCLVSTTSTAETDLQASCLCSFRLHEVAVRLSASESLTSSRENGRRRQVQGCGEVDEGSEEVRFVTFSNICAIREGEREVSTLQAAFD
jgi:hypothetical protein